MRSRPVPFVLFALAAALPSSAAAAPVPEGADWSEATFPSSDGHGDGAAETVRDSADPSFNLPPAQQPAPAGGD